MAGGRAWLANVPRIAAVLFDLGNTLWHFPDRPPQDVVAAETRRRIFRLLRRWGFEVTPERFLLASDIRKATEEATAQAFHGDCRDPGYPDVCRRVAARHGLELTPGQAEELWEAWNLEGAFVGRGLFPDVLETMHWLKGKGYRLGSVTNRGWAGPRFQQELRDLGLADLFEVVAMSCLVGYMKPDPRVFHYALDRMGIEPEEAVMVGDSLRGDVQGAKALGMTTVWRRRPARGLADGSGKGPGEWSEAPGSVVPDYVIDTLAELKSLPILS